MQEIVKTLVLTGPPGPGWDNQINAQTAQGWLVKFLPGSVVDPDKRAWVNIVLLYQEQL